MNTDTMICVDYSDKCLAVVGNTKPLEVLLKELGGEWNDKLNDEKCQGHTSGWLICMSHKKKLLEQIKHENERLARFKTVPKLFVPLPNNDFSPEQLQALENMNNCMENLTKAIQDDLIEQEKDYEKSQRSIAEFNEKMKKLLPTTYGKN